MEVRIYDRKDFSLIISEAYPLYTMRSVIRQTEIVLRVSNIEYEKDNLPKGAVIVTENRYYIFTEA